MRPIAMVAAVLGFVTVLGSQLPRGDEAFGADARPSATASMNRLLADFPLARTAERSTHDPRAIREAARTANPAIASEDLNAVVEQYCTTCHSDQLKSGNLSLQGFDVAEADEHAEVAEKMIHKLRLAMMPPPDMPRPGGDTLTVLAETLEGIIDQAAASTPSPPGIRRFQRLNRSEYERVIKDLLGLDVDAERWLPGDRFVRSYDTWSTVQDLSTTTLEAYLGAAEDISRMAIGVGNQLPPPLPVSYQVPVEVSQHAWDHVEGTPFGTRGGTAVSHDFPVDGEYVFSLDTELGRGTAPADVDISIDEEPAALLHLPVSSGPAVSTEPIFVRAGQHQVSVAFVREMEGPYDDPLSPHDLSSGGTSGGGWANHGLTGLPHLSGFTIDGPYNPAPGDASGDERSREIIFSCYPSMPDEELSCAESILSRLAREAYRRPLAAEDLTALMSVYEEGREDGDFELGIRRALQWILSNPSFVFRLEREPEGLSQGETYALNDVDLASRLSFFLWGTGPDGELLELAEKGTLNDPEVLEEQVRRMLADPRSMSLATRFAPQWLRLDDLAGKRPLPEFFPDFNRAVAESMHRETELLFDHLVREDRSFLELFTADYTFVNEPLAHHYGMPSPGSDNEFVKIPISDPNRFGLLGHGSVLMVTSFDERTSPVVRGQWVMEVLLGSPPPPPPPNVPLLEATAEASEGRILTTRERLEIHRANPTCNACHQYMDPIGLALDNFDGVGRWRVRDENGVLLNTESEFYDGTAIGTPVDLREVILQRPEPVVRNFVNNLFGYAIGRRAEYFDQPTVRAIERTAKANDYRMSSFILGVVQSDAFRTRQVDARTDDSNN
ncbi:MAG: DUF1592 domain-containing protein [Gemmatimonas sp.]|nr:DUF1592 domain-containing protein [Gemmatimonas sp.]